MKEIEVIASFDLEGNKKPLKFKFVGDQQENVVVEVKKILQKDTRKSLGEYVDIYKCVSEIDGIRKKYELHYNRSSCQWKLKI